MSNIDILLSPLSNVFKNFHILYYVKYGVSNSRQVKYSNSFLACVASVSNRVIARKLERHLFFFALVPVFQTNLARKRLLRRLIPFKHFQIAHCHFLICLFKFPLSVLNLMCHVRLRKLNFTCHIPKFLYFPCGKLQKLSNIKFLKVCIMSNMKMSSL